MAGGGRGASAGRNCAYNINLRHNEARFKRERCLVEREIKGMERIFKQNVRKLNAAQRGVMSMLGHDPYPNCGRDDVLFEHNQPGFCYRRDGQPRRFPSLLESKTRKIIQDLEGKLGILTKQASNIISDSPMMAEVLSSPEIVEILCDLRTTAVLISDQDLFAQFASSLMQSPNSPLTQQGESPMDCLLQYRKHLIQEFFDQLRIQLEIRCCPTAEETGLSSRAAVDDSGKNSNDKSPQQTGIHQRAPSKEWNEAVIESLRKAKLEEEQKLTAGVKDETDTSLLDSLALLPFTITVNPEDNLFMTPDAATHLMESVSTVLAAPPANTAAEITAAQTLTDLASSPTVQIKHSPPNPAAAVALSTRSKAKRNDFDNFVKSLVTQVENVAEIGKHMGQLQKRKLQFDTVANPLVRLLRKKSLFSSLTEDDLLFYEYDGGRRDAESTIARGLNMSQPRPGGFTFRVPSRSADILSNNNNPTMDPATNELLFSARSSANVSARERTLPQSKLFCGAICMSTQKSLKRLCCSACNAKIREQCNEAQARDRKNAAASEFQSWRIGQSDAWIRNYQMDSKPHHLLTSVPLTIRKNYAMYSPSKLIPTKFSSEFGSESTYGMLENRTPVRRGAPTPTGKRKNLLPEVTKLMTAVDGSVFGAVSEWSTGTVGSKSRDNNNVAAAAAAREKARRLASIQDDADTWTLKVDRMDITKLRHELESANVREKIALLEKAMLGESPGQFS